MSVVGYDLELFKSKRIRRVLCNSAFWECMLETCDHRATLILCITASLTTHFVFYLEAHYDAVTNLNLMMWCETGHFLMMCFYLHCNCLMFRPSFPEDESFLLLSSCYYSVFINHWPTFHFDQPFCTLLCCTYMNQKSRWSTHTVCVQDLPLCTCAVTKGWVKSP